MYKSLEQINDFTPPANLRLGPSIRLDCDELRNKKISVSSVEILADNLLEVKFHVGVGSVAKSFKIYQQEFLGGLSRREMTDQDFEDYLADHKTFMAEWGMQALEDLCIPMESVRSAKIIDKRPGISPAEIIVHFAVEPDRSGVYFDWEGTPSKALVNDVSIRLPKTEVDQRLVYNWLLDEHSDESSVLKATLREFAYLFPWTYWWRFYALECQMKGDIEEDTYVRLMYSFNSVSPPLYSSRQVNRWPTKCPLFSAMLRPVLVK